ncbi:MAG: ABC transporter ATP-binding protein, partial [Clostridia bacterium]|nr:ABC transporter ATP-binding protein [Clostridia bacterium]
MKNKRTVRKVLSYIRPFLPRILLTLLLSLGVVAGTLYTPILVGRAIDLCTAGRIDFALLQKPLLAAGILIALTALLQWLLGILNADVTYKVVRNIRKDAIRKIHRLPLAYLDAHSVGDTANRVLSDVDTFSDGLLMGFTQFFTGAGTILGTLIFMLIL